MHEHTYARTHARTHIRHGQPEQMEWTVSFLLYRPLNGGMLWILYGAPPRSLDLRCKNRASSGTVAEGGKRATVRPSVYSFDSRRRGGRGGISARRIKTAARRRDATRRGRAVTARIGWVMSAVVAVSRHFWRPRVPFAHLPDAFQSLTNVP